MKASDLYGSQYLAASDLDGKSVEAEITGVGAEKFQGARENLRSKITLDLKDVKKKMVLNATNVAALIEAFGDDTDNWLGRVIVLDCGRTMYQGKMVPTLRVRPAKPAKGK